MANYFQLTRVGESTPSEFTRVDEELCRYFGEHVDSVQWFRGWYVSIGMAFAMGDSPARIREIFGIDDREILDVLDYLITYYDIDAWYSRGRG